jgi:hypothetical protein
VKRVASEGERAIVNRSCYGEKESLVSRGAKSYVRCIAFDDLLDYVSPWEKLKSKSMTVGPIANELRSDFMSGFIPLTFPTLLTSKRYYLLPVQSKHC